LGVIELRLRDLGSKVAIPATSALSPLYPSEQTSLARCLIERLNAAEAFNTRWPLNLFFDLRRWRSLARLSPATHLSRGRTRKFSESKR
jgi:hypothetical protein